MWFVYDVLDAVPLEVMFVCINDRTYVCCSECYVVSNDCDEHTPASKRHSIQAVEMSQMLQIVSKNLPNYRFLGNPAMRTGWMAVAAHHKSG